MTLLKRCLLVSLLLFVIWPYEAFATQPNPSLSQAEETYTLAVRSFEKGPEEYVAARRLFESIRYYQESIMYLCYIDAVTALTYCDLDTSLAAFRMLGIANFKDADVYYLYTSARRAEQVGQYNDAITLYESIELLDSHDRLLSLRKLVFQMDNPDFELPHTNAKANGYAYVMSDGIPVYDTPNDRGAFASLPFYQLLQINAFAYDKEGRLYAQTTIRDPQCFINKQQAPKNGYILAYYLHFLSNEEMQVLGLPYRSPLIGGELKWLGTITKRNTTISASPDQVIALCQVSKGDTLWIVGEVVSALGVTYYKVLQPNQGQQNDDNAFGYVPADHFAESPIPGPTPMPLLAPVSSVTSIPGINAISIAAPEQIYNQAFGYFLAGTEKALTEAKRLFLLQREYQNSAIYADYTQILLQAEMGLFDEARKTLADLEDTGYFWCRKANLYKGVAPNEPIEIADPAVILKYLQARELESKDLFGDAFLLYSQLGNYLDAMQRCVATGAKDADGLNTPALFMADALSDTQVSKQLERWPMHPFIINILPAETNDESMRYMFQQREYILKSFPHTKDEAFVMLPKGSTVITYDAYQIPKDIDTLLHKKFIKALFNSLQNQGMMSSLVVYFEDIVLEKILSIDVSRDLKRWNVCAMFKMTEPSTGDIVYMPFQMSSEGAQSSCYFDSVSRSTDAFIRSYPLLFTPWATDADD